jgi:hypothetical protein
VSWVALIPRAISLALTVVDGATSLAGAVKTLVGKLKRKPLDVDPEDTQPITWRDVQLQQTQIRKAARPPPPPSSRYE